MEEEARMTEKHHFLGEFGYFAMSYVGLVGRYLGRRPEMRLQIKTHADCGKILEYLYPGRVEAVPYIGPPISSLRNCFGLRARGFRNPQIRRAVNGFEGPTSMIKVVGPGEFRVGTTEGLDKSVVKKFGNRLGYKIRKPITYGEQKKSESVVLFPRNRRNGRLSETRNNPIWHWDDVLEVVYRELGRDLDLIQIGIEGENRQLDGTRFVEGIFEQINALNNARCMISSYSGLGQFASICGCRVAYIRPTQAWGKPVMRDIGYFAPVCFVDSRTIRTAPAELAAFLRNS